MFKMQWRYGSEWFDMNDNSIANLLAIVRTEIETSNFEWRIFRMRDIVVMAQSKHAYFG